jgi:hypothetical protein
VVDLYFIIFKYQIFSFLPQRCPATGVAEKGRKKREEGKEGEKGRLIFFTKSTTYVESSRLGPLIHRPKAQSKDKLHGPKGRINQPQI